MLELHAIAGPAFGVLFKLEGTQATLGQDPGKATWPVMADITMAAVHCEFAVDSGAAVVSPVPGAFLTVNGQPVSGPVALKHGDMLSTGASVFSVVMSGAGNSPATVTAPPVSIGGQPAPVTPLPEAPPREDPQKDQVPFIAYTRIDDRPSVTSFLAGRPGNLYAVIDAARSPIIYPLLQQCGEPYVPLFTLEGMPEDLKAYAPYLAQLGPKSVLLQQLVLQGWSDHWCIYLSAPLAFEDVRVHLKKFLMVKLDDKEVFFRFYDPRVLRVYLPACTPYETERFFGSIAAFYCPDTEGACVEYRLRTAAAGQVALDSALHRF